MSTTSTTITTTTTTRDSYRGDRYGPMEWAQQYGDRQTDERETETEMKLN